MRFRFCQFIEAEPSANEFCKCDREAKPGSSYCPEHHVRCHTAAEAAAEAVEAHEKVYVAPIEISGAQDDQLSASISGGRGQGWTQVCACQSRRRSLLVTTHRVAPHETWRSPKQGRD